MLIREIEGATRSLGAPADWDQTKGKCDVLPIADVMTESGPFMVSAWTPTAEELIALNAGAPVHLWIQGTNHPVVALSVDAAHATQEPRVVIDGTPLTDFESLTLGIALNAFLMGLEIDPHALGDGERAVAMRDAYRKHGERIEKLFADAEGNRAPIDVHQQSNTQHEGGIEQ